MSHTSESYNPRLLVLLHFLFGSWVVWDAFSRRWLSDDAFISFQYARNLSRGNGLVYNVGEVVEGYTNLLWTLWLGVGMMAGLPPELFAHATSLGLLVVLLYGLYQFRIQGVSIPFFIVGGMFHIRVFATSGLETQSFLTAIVLFFWALYRHRWRWVGITMIAGMLTRPEGGLLWLSILPTLFRYYPVYLKRVALVGGLTLFCLTLWRLFYYGDIVPNTYWAKAGDANWVQGLLYVRLFFQMYWYVPLGWVAAIALLRGEDTSLKPLALTAFLFSTVYALHVLRVGGDFMMARFALPFSLPLLISLGIWVQLRLSDQWRWLGGGLAGAMAVTCIPPAGLNEINQGVFGISGVTEESHWYPEAWRAQAEFAGNAVHSFFEGTDIQVVIYGAQAMFAYYADLPYVLEGMSGLTDRELARMDNRDQRVGHGRKATIPYLQERGVDLYIDFRLKQGTAPLNQIQLGPLSGAILSYKSQNLRILRERGAEFQDFPSYLDWYIQTIETRSSSQISADLEQFESYYFQFSGEKVDAHRRDVLQKAAQGKIPAVSEPL